MMSIDVQKVFERVSFNEEYKKKMELLWINIGATATYIDATISGGPEKTLAIRKLQECLFWCEAALTAEYKGKNEKGVKQIS